MDIPSKQDRKAVWKEISDAAKLFLRASNLLEVAESLGYLSLGVTEAARMYGVDLDVVKLEILESLAESRKVKLRPILEKQILNKRALTAKFTPLRFARFQVRNAILQFAASHTEGFTIDGLVQLQLLKKISRKSLAANLFSLATRGDCPLERTIAGTKGPHSVPAVYRLRKADNKINE